jgi:hypothetical protein
MGSQSTAMFLDYSPVIALPSLLISSRSSRLVISPKAGRRERKNSSEGKLVVLDHYLILWRSMLVKRAGSGRAPVERKDPRSWGAWQISRNLRAIDC